MIDTTHVDLLALTGQYTDLKRAAATGGGEWHGPCPICHDGVDRFVVQPYAQPYPRWSCRRCSPQWGDAIGFVQALHGVGFRDALKMLNLDPGQLPQLPHMQRMTGVPQDNDNQYTALTDEPWQHRAADYVAYAEKHLWQTGFVLNYLREHRHLSDDVIRSARLGYNPRSLKMQWGTNDVYLPQGIVIPWFYEGKIWRVNHRLPRGAHKKYMQVAGGANGLYNAGAIRSGSTVVMVEGEFDALVIASKAADLIEKFGVVPVATGAGSWSRTLRWITKLCKAYLVMLAFDTDDAGDVAAAYWHDRLGAELSERLRPTAHDVTDMVSTGDDVRHWIGYRAGLL